MRKLIIILFVLVSQIIFAQTQKLSKDDKKVAADKMLARVKKTKADTIYVDSLISVGKQFLNSNLIFSESCFIEASTISGTNYGELNTRYIEALHQRAIVYLKRGEFDKSIELNRYVLDLRKRKLGASNFECIRSKMNIALVFSALNERKAYEEMMDSVTQELLYANYYDPRFKLHFQNYSNYLFSANRFEESFNLLYELSKIQFHNKDYENYVRTKFQIGYNYISYGNNEAAISELKAAMKSYDKFHTDNLALRRDILEQLATPLINLKEFGEAELILSELETISKGEPFYLGSARSGLALIARINGNEELSKDYIRSVVKLFVKRDSDSKIQLAEHYNYLSSLFGLNKFDLDAVDFGYQAYNLYKTYDPVNSRFIDISVDLATSLQNVGQCKEAIQIYEDAKNSKLVTQKPISTYLRLCGNLARCYSSIGRPDMAVKTRQSSFEVFFSKNIDLYSKSLVENQFEDQQKDLFNLGLLYELEKLLLDFNDYYKKYNDVNSHLNCLTSLTNLYVTYYYEPEKALKYIDSVEALIKQNNIEGLYNALFNYSKGNFYRLQNTDSRDYVQYYQQAYEDFLKESLFERVEFDFSAFRIAFHLMINGQDNEALKIYSDFTDLKCEFFGINSYECLSSKIKQIQFLEKVVGKDSLKIVIEQLENKYPKFLGVRDLRLSLNEMKLEAGIFENQKQIIQENIDLADLVYRNDPKYKLLKRQDLIHWYFQNDSIHLGLSIWDSIINKINSDQNYEVIQFMYKLYASDLLHYTGDFKEAIDVLENKVNISGSNDYAYNLLIEGYIKDRQNNRALQLIEDKEKYLISTYGNESIEHLNFLKYRIDLYRLSEDMANLIKWGEISYRLSEKLFKDDLYNQIFYLSHLAHNYTGLGNPKKAIELCEDKIKEFHLSLDEIHPANLSSKLHFKVFELHFILLSAKFSEAIYCFDIGKINEELNNEIDKLINFIIGTNDKELITLTNILIPVKFIFKNNISQSEERQLESALLEIEKTFENVWESEDFLASFYDFLENDAKLMEFNVNGKIKLPKSYYERIGSYNKADSVEYYDVVNRIEKMQSSKFVLSDYQQLNLKSQTQFYLNYSALSFIEKIHFQDSLLPHKYKLITHQKKNHRSSHIGTSQIFELLLNSSGSISENRRLLNNKISNTPELIILNEVLKGLNEKIAFNELDSISTKHLEDSINYVEQQLYQKSGIKVNPWYSYSDFLGVIDYDELIIQTFRILGYGDGNSLTNDSVIYLHFVIEKDFSDPVVYAQKMTLDEEREMVERYSYFAHGKGRERKDTLSNDKLFGFLNKHLKGKKKIVYFPDGIYNQLNLRTIYNTSVNDYLALTHEIKQFDYPKILFNKSTRDYSNNLAELFGFPDFKSQFSLSNGSDLPQYSRAINSDWMDSISRGVTTISPLPGTFNEVENISKSLNSKGWNVNKRLSSEANEKNIKAIKDPRILHIATHGYFLQDVETRPDENNYLGMKKNRILSDPMLRSGLLLAGASTAIELGDISPNNGVFSAYEASLLDLFNTELVVLSACETGRGEIKNSEGVYGLRKAFADAGAKNVIMSLWKVDDKVTQEFMALFYEIWLNQKTTIREAFDKTQRDIMAKYPQPYYWGAFILVEN